jgi:small GTP-binding protein
MSIINVKIGLYGDSDVGKSTLISYLQTNKFQKTKDITIGVDYFTIEYTINDNIKVKFQIWDTAGQERYNSIIEKYYSVNIPIFMFDVSDKTSFDHLHKWINQYNEYKRYEATFIYCIGNKTDLGYNIAPSIIDEFCDEYNVLYEDNSYINNYNIDNIFRKISNQIYELYKNKSLNIPIITIDNMVSFKGYRSIEDEKPYMNYRRCCN